MQLLLVLVAAALGVLVRPYALDIGPVADDYAQLGMLKGQYPVSRGPFDLFNFGNGTVLEQSRLTTSGFFPWWSDPRVRLSMWRPLSSALMWLDLHAFGDHYRFYHLHSLVWWLGVVLIVSSLWRRALPLATGALALVLFVCDEAHGVLLAWIANRNAVTGSFFALLALTLYVSTREGRIRGGLVWAALCFSLALGFGEYALTVGGYFLAFECFRGPGRLRERAWSLGAVFVPTVAFLFLRVLLGYGPRHSGIYVDPSVEPVAFAQAAIERIPVFAADLLLALRADYWTFGFPWTDWLIKQHLVDFHWSTDLLPWRRAHTTIGAVVLGACVMLATAVLRKRPKHDPLWWLSVGACLSLIPAVAPFPSSRLVVAALVGFCPLLATFVLEQIRPRLSARCVAAVALCALHLTVPVWHTYTETRNLHFGAEDVRKAVRQMGVEDARLPRQRMIVMNAVDASLGFYIPLIRLTEGLAAPERCWVLSGAPVPMRLYRSAVDAFVVTLIDGQSATGTSYEQMFRSSRDPLRVGDTFDLAGMRVEVLAVRAGGFVSARFTFDRPLDDPSLVFLHAGSAGLQPVQLPGVGEHIYVPPPTHAAFMEF